MKVLRNLNYKSGYIAAITRGHNSGVCLLKDGNIVFSIEEERISRVKYDGGPFASMIKILEYTNEIDYLVVAHTTPLGTSGSNIDYTGDNVYTGLARKLGLISNDFSYREYQTNHPQVLDLSWHHHKLHAALAFYKSGWSSATALIVDGAGTFYPASSQHGQTMLYETESIFACNYPFNIRTIYKHYGTNDPSVSVLHEESAEHLEEDGKYISLITDRAGIVKTYEATTDYCGFNTIEAGKTMGLFPYGDANSNIPELFTELQGFPVGNRNLVIPNYPGSATINSGMHQSFIRKNDIPTVDQTIVRNFAYETQVQTQEQVLKLIRKAAELSNNNNIVISGGYALNCVANYFYLQQLKDDDINIYVEPISSDAGTAIGAALLTHYAITQSSKINTSLNSLYLGGAYLDKLNNINNLIENNEEIIDADYNHITKLLIEKNIVTIFQGKSENGPRALGNRSILFNPQFEDGKDFVNTVKNREYFRPFAGTVLKEYAQEWFEMEGLEESPYMMYAVSCKEEKRNLIPSIIHVDGSCRIQTVTQEQNVHFYNLIKNFYDKTNVPILFNTSFNLGGDPLVETIEDALKTLRSSEIEYLYLPEIGKLIIIKNK